AATQSRCDRVGTARSQPRPGRRPQENLGQGELQDRAWGVGGAERPERLRQDDDPRTPPGLSSAGQWTPALERRAAGRTRSQKLPVAPALQEPAPAPFPR